jgi:hypothetical protein
MSKPKHIRGLFMVQIDRSNTAIVGLDLYTVVERHQLGLVDALKEQIKSWKSNSCFVSASVHQSLDGSRVFTYSQWQPNLDHRSFDGWRCINFGHWRSLEDFTAMDSNRPFSPIFGEMLDLANNEYQKTLHEVIFAT